ncbi:DUF523 domain-containing protein [Proteiniclasticum sp. BAD-10]|uniref:DUF523 domain-containing protein n=1 Tax=Proteiniclasticum sediminis TaxID=2804028 RepID=A0A941CLJ5_9CLOT|nr:DUF523 domain-containing protein [Proteiniclasticum sediminis]MBR0574876.1 DUF523 domain-containing protein [Proteiniclasticum sediminis]
MKEKILVSACLLGEKVRYDGRGYDPSPLESLKERYTLIPVCPEVLGGLSVPRDPAEILSGRVLTRQGRDVTAEFEEGARKVLTLCQQEGITKAILKSKSPSCGKDRIYDGSHTKTLIPGHGKTVELLLESTITVYTEFELGGL